MRYPRLPKKLDRRCKLTEEDIYRIRILRENGWLLSDLAKKFNVSGTLIYYWTNEKSRQVVLKQARQLRHQNKEKWRESTEYLRKVNPKIREYQRRKENERRKRLKLLEKRLHGLAQKQSLKKS